jgi:hypothetical protein
MFLSIACHEKTKTCDISCFVEPREAVSLAPIFSKLVFFADNMKEEHCGLMGLKNG